MGTQNFTISIFYMHLNVLNVYFMSTANVQVQFNGMTLPLFSDCKLKINTVNITYFLFVITYKISDALSNL